MSELAPVSTMSTRRPRIFLPTQYKTITRTVSTAHSTATLRGETLHVRKLSESRKPPIDGGRSTHSFLAISLWRLPNASLNYCYFICHPTIPDESNQTFIRHDDTVLLPERMHPEHKPTVAFVIKIQPKILTASHEPTGTFATSLR